MTDLHMRVLVINPNTTASMTRKIGAAAMAAASKGTLVTSVNPNSGPASIEGYFDEAFSVPGLIGEIRKAPEMDAYVVACFDDTGLDAARCIATAPVVGIGEAAFHMASLVSGTFSVVTTLSGRCRPSSTTLRSMGWRRGAPRYGRRTCRCSRSKTQGSDARQRISREIARALDEDRAEAIVLGCAGMTDLAASLTAEHGVPVLDGVACAVKLCEGLVGLGLKTSKVGGYAAPRAKAFAESSHHTRRKAARARGRRGALPIICNRSGEPDAAASQCDGEGIAGSRDLAEIDEGLLRSLAARAASLSIGGGRVLFEEGAPSDALYILVSGALAVTARAADGSSIPLSELYAGDTIGEMGVLTGEPRTATVTALRDSDLLRIGGDDLLELVRISPGLSLAFARVVSRRLARSRRNVAARTKPRNFGLIPSPGLKEPAAPRRKPEACVRPVWRNRPRRQGPCG